VDYFRVVRNPFRSDANRRDHFPKCLSEPVGKEKKGLHETYAFEEGGPEPVFSA